MTLHTNVKTQLLTNLQAGSNDIAQLNDALRLLSKWRSVLIQNTLIQQQGLVVQQGVLAGLDFLPNSAEGCHIAKLLGCYEQPLQPYIQKAMALNYHNCEYRLCRRLLCRRHGKTNAQYAG